MDLIFSPFSQKDFPEYLAWFQDVELNKHLGPMVDDDEWLDYVLRQQEGETEINGFTYSIFYQGNLKGILGIDFPTNQMPAYVITSLAIDPSSRGMGFGSSILTQISTLHPLNKNEFFLAYVGRDNKKAYNFFLKNSWNCISKPPENNNMFLFKKKAFNE